MDSLCQRNFNVNYYALEENRWRVVSHLQDDHHDITVSVIVSVPEMVIEDAEIKFNRYPLENCLLIERKAEKLVGIKILEDYRRKVPELFMGPQGCPNIMTLLSVSVPGIAYFYFPYLLKTGKMRPEEWQEMVNTRFANDCLAHSLIRD